MQNPSRKIMLAEEPGTTNATDNPEGGLPARPIEDRRWVPSPLNGLRGDPLTTRHTGKADVALADGRVESVTWEFRMDPLNSRPDQVTYPAAISSLPPIPGPPGCEAEPSIITPLELRPV
jgi:prepilin-type processing-associated H-X9-DG protein